MKDTIKITLRQRITLILLLGAQFMLSADFSILNVALPEIGSNLGFSLANLQWVATAFSLAAAGLTLLFGRIADLLGRRKLFIAGIIMLGVGSLIGGAATSPLELIVGRTLQGVATAMVTPAALALLTTSFKEGPLRDKALSLNGVILSAGFTVGSVLGGVLTSVLDWRWAFFINVPVAIAVAILTPAYIKESKGGEAKHLDITGALTVTFGLGALIYGVSALGESGFEHATTWMSLIAAFVLLGLFSSIEYRGKHPLLPIKVLRMPTVRWGNIGGFMVFAMETAIVYLVTLYLQKVLHLSPAITGLAFGLLGTAAFVVGMKAAPVIERFGNRRVLAYGLVGQGITAITLAMCGTDPGWLWFVLAVTLVNGAVHILALVAFMITATSGLSNKDEGAASSIVSMTQLSSISLGIPLMSAVLTALMHVFASVGDDGFLPAFSLTLVVDGALTIIVALLIAWRLGRAPGQR